MDMANASQFSMKLETYLRRANIAYRPFFPINPKPGPAGKLPFVVMNGKNMAGSGLILDRCETHIEAALDRYLSHEQQAVSLQVRLVSLDSKSLAKQAFDRRRGSVVLDCFSPSPIRFQSFAPIEQCSKPHFLCDLISPKC